MLSGQYSIRAVIAVLAAAVSAAAWSAQAARRTPGLPPGAWTVTWIEPRLAPAAEAHVTEFVRCYLPEDAARAANPVVPPTQEAKCKTDLMSVGGDIVYDTSCPDADHQLRMFACGSGYCGKYRYVTRKAPRGTGIFESVVIIRPSKQKCDGI